MKNCEKKTLRMAFGGQMDPSALEQRLNQRLGSGTLTMRGAGMLSDIENQRRGDTTQRYGIDTNAGTARMNDATQRYGVDTQAGTARYGVDAQSATSKMNDATSRFDIGTRADTARYGVDAQSATAQMDDATNRYGMDTQAGTQRYQSDNSLQGSMYQSDAPVRNAYTNQYLQQYGGSGAGVDPTRTRNMLAGNYQMPQRPQQQPQLDRFGRPQQQHRSFGLRNGGEIHAAMGFGSEGYTDRYGTRWMSSKDGVEFENKQRAIELANSEKEMQLGMAGANVAQGQGRGRGGSRGFGLRDGGDLQTGKGGDVPGTGHGDKIPAKYEPGEFVVSNDMLKADPSLLPHLRELRKAVLAQKGMTPEQADAKAIHMDSEGAGDERGANDEKEPKAANKGFGIRAGDGFGIVPYISDNEGGIGRATRILYPDVPSTPAIEYDRNGNRVPATRSELIGRDSPRVLYPDVPSSQRIGNTQQVTIENAPEKSRGIPISKVGVAAALATHPRELQPGTLPPEVVAASGKPYDQNTRFDFGDKVEKKKDLPGLDPRALKLLGVGKSVEQPQTVDTRPGLPAGLFSWGKKEEAPAKISISKLNANGNGGDATSGLGLGLGLGMDQKNVPKANSSTPEAGDAGARDQQRATANPVVSQSRVRTVDNAITPPQPATTTASKDAAPVLQGATGKDVGYGITRFNVPGQSPLFTNMTDAEGMRSNDALLSRKPQSDQDRIAGDNLSNRFAQRAQAEQRMAQRDAELRAEYQQGQVDNRSFDHNARVNEIDAELKNLGNKIPSREEAPAINARIAALQAAKIKAGEQFATGENAITTTGMTNDAHSADNASRLQAQKLQTNESARQADQGFGLRQNEFAQAKADHDRITSLRSIAFDQNRPEAERNAARAELQTFGKGQSQTLQTPYKAVTVKDENGGERVVVVNEATGQTVGQGGGRNPMPADPSQRKAGVTYDLADGRRVFWDGKGPTLVQ